MRANSPACSARPSMVAMRSRARSLPCVICRRRAASPSRCAGVTSPSSRDAMRGPSSASRRDSWRRVGMALMSAHASKSASIHLGAADIDSHGASNISSSSAALHCPASASAQPCASAAGAVESPGSILRGIWLISSAASAAKRSRYRCAAARVPGGAAQMGSRSFNNPAT